MPTIVVVDDFKVMIMPNDHRPPHVHVFHNNGRVHISIGDNANRPFIMEAIDMSNREITKALKIVIEHQKHLLKAWRQIHG
ncbi:MAG: DUF4160 domain-containing protein [Candidatus Riflebacteria bacterium]|nr:DUF4160 domain-containing protein [Candidatus Riflebacteria bacterium]